MTTKPWNPLISKMEILRPDLAYEQKSYAINWDEVASMLPRIGSVLRIVILLNEDENGVAIRCHQMLALRGIKVTTTIQQPTTLNKMVKGYITLKRVSFRRKLR